MNRFYKWIGCALLLAVGFILGAMNGSLMDWKEKRFSFSKKKSSQVFFPVQENKPIVIVVPSYNNSEWVEKNLRSIFEQKYDNYRIIYINDASRDETLAKVEEMVTQKKQWHRFTLINNPVNKGACENIYLAIQSCDPNEIAMILDGDDWFAHDRVLERINEVYADPSVWLTYGSYIEYPSYSYKVANFAEALPKDIIQHHAVRAFTRKHWYLSHLRTFYVSLCQRVKQEDLMWEGKYYDAAYDLAFMIPMVEMAGEHVKFLKEVFYIYNRATPLNDNKIRAKRQREISEHIIALPVYPELTSRS